MIKAIELFAGVGGFRLGLEKANIKTVWANQYEPETKAQHAFNVYKERFPEGIKINKDIAEVAAEDIPAHDLLVGGFPCQDYSVARSLNGENGIEGKKGVLFWQIMRIVNHHDPKYILLENVNRLLKSPAKQRGRDFSIMLSSLWHAGYNVEWRVINAADYGYAQKRRRVFIFAYKDFLPEVDFFEPIFPSAGQSEKHKEQSFIIPADRVEITENYSATYWNSGKMINGHVTTKELLPEEQEAKTLGDILQEARQVQGAVNEKYFLTDEVGRNGKTSFEHFEYMKGAKKIERTAANGHKYTYAEGSMAFPDKLHEPARTMLTSEGTKNRSSHIVKDLDTGRLRYLTPIECELLNGFPANWTESLTDRKRYFCMGNALVVGLAEKMAFNILNISSIKE